MRKKSARKPEAQVIKVILVLDNDNIRYLNGKDAQKYIADLDGVLGFMQATRSYMLPENFLKVRWKEIKKSKASKLLK